MIYDDKVKVIEGADAELFQKHMSNLHKWGAQMDPPKTVDIKPETYVKSKG